MNKRYPFMKNLSMALICCMFIGLVQAQMLTPQQYIDTYKELAIKEMKRSGIPASITLAQGLLETECGNSILVKKSNNHFGIKCKSNWTGESVAHTDDAPNECFRKYATAEDSYKDHSDFLKNSSRYSNLFSLNPTDYKGWAYGLKSAGYATNPRYPVILITNIEKYNLQQYDSMSETDPMLFADATAPVISQKEETNAIIQPVSNEPAPVLAHKPGNKTKFNGLKAIFATKGTSLLALALGNDISLSKLLDFNDLKNDGLLKEDQIVYLEKKAKQGNRDFYISLQNESLRDVAQNNGVQLQSLVQFNNLTEHSNVHKGQKIYLRPIVSGATAATR